MRDQELAWICQSAETFLACSEHKLVEHASVAKLIKLAACWIFRFFLSLKYSSLSLLLTNLLTNLPLREARTVDCRR